MPTKGFSFEYVRVFLTLSFGVSPPFFQLGSRLTLPGRRGGICDSAAHTKTLQFFRVCPLPGSTPVNPRCEPRELTERRIRKASYWMALGCTGSRPPLCQAATPVVSELLMDAGGCGWRGDEFHAPGLHLRPRVWGVVFFSGGEWPLEISIVAAYRICGEVLRHGRQVRHRIFFITLLDTH